MARRELEVGAWGDVSVQRVKGGPSPVVARARFRGFDGKVRKVERWGPSPRGARQALLAELEERKRRGSGGQLTGASTLSEAAEVWLSRIQRLADLGQRSPGTVETYGRQLEGHVLPRIGGLRLRELTTPVVDRFVLDVYQDVGAATARTCRSIVSGALSLAVRQGAIAANPARELERLEGTRAKEPRALTSEEQAKWFMGMTGDQVAVRQDLVDFSAFLLATGLRIGEALAVLWTEVDLDTGALTVTSTLIRVTGQGLLRKTTKSKAGQRALLLPTWCVAMLRRRSEVGVAPDEPIFATVDGRFRDPRNVSRQLADARDRLGFGWVTSHTWRKTMATILDGGGASPRMIADQLGHSRVSMSLDFYLGRRSVDPRVLAALEAVDPRRFTLESGGQSGGSVAQGEGT
ncbi:tyrosine-type recombinase/integrase [Phycicoccus sp. Soil802]|uniref:tyrosine-type recombinase/integrase n=1 Tax=Phycicoccus sp. Soil802 TaxID=1736414 RepID=UPI003527449C